MNLKDLRREREREREIERSVCECLRVKPRVQAMQVKTIKLNKKPLALLEEGAG